MLLIESVSKDGLLRATFKSLSLTDNKFPPRAETLAEIGKLRNSYVLLPPTCADAGAVKTIDNKRKSSLLIYINTNINKNIRVLNEKMGCLLPRYINSEAIIIS